MAFCAELSGSECSDPTQSAVNSSHLRYGVRSYLHHFYEECTASIWERDEDFQIQRSPSRWSSVLWKVCLAFGTLIMIIGMAVLTVGYAATPKIEAFGEEELLFVDSQAARYNRVLYICKLAGAALFCIGGSLMAIGVLLSMFTPGDSKEEWHPQQRFWERLAEPQATYHPITWAPAPGERKVPITLSKVQNVQPAPET
ncbi:hypothetical protein MATL_G00136380 [Megalops atlanticus]|uniref:Neurensin-1 n=1 Tax=Megalops atlanticus TaxID=7932 RepID=A0A9D3Q111_MEGAT|nr:hypothetical protein MATL_G00136380 [Megalops atlanticus]